MLVFVITFKKYRICREWVVQTHINKHLLNTYHCLGVWRGRRNCRWSLYFLVSRYRCYWFCSLFKVWLNHCLPRVLPLGSWLWGQPQDYCPFLLYYFNPSARDIISTRQVPSLGSKLELWGNHFIYPKSKSTQVTWKKINVAFKTLYIILATQTENLTE